MTEKTKIKQIREKTGLSQSQFAKKYDIPLKTLQHWEIGTSTPTDYLVKLIENDVNNQFNNQSNLITIPGDNKKKKTMYYYDEEKKTIYDKNGNCLTAKIDFDATSMHNLGIYLDFLFEDYYKAIASFNESLEADKKLPDKIEWERFW